jgi:hypothetical protein
MALSELSGAPSRRRVFSVRRRPPAYGKRGAVQHFRTLRRHCLTPRSGRDRLTQEPGA